MDLKNSRVSSFLRILFCGTFLAGFGIFNSTAQFDGKAGSPGSAAIFKDSAVFKNWANACTVSRGYRDIFRPENGKVTSGLNEMATGRAGENGVVSLGDGGTAVLTFPKPIADGPGPDFAVFENAFLDNFLELAFVEVSSDGIRFVRFPAISNTFIHVQIGPFDTLSDPTLLRNLAGKYRAQFGTPFDLYELKDSNGLDISRISHVRIVDVVGSINPVSGSSDSRGVLINDPYPTPFESGGFDLDAVGVIHERTEEPAAPYFCPNPASSFIRLKETSGSAEFYLTDLAGKKVHTSDGLFMDLQSVPPGIYLAISETADRKKLVQKILKNN